ncbi:MAG: ion transporter [Roseobacter sp.]|jgi:voltage-gated potassium channel|nr:ion transporter [Roseobacter sp.]
MPSKQYLRDTLDNTDTSHGKVFGYSIQLLIVASLVGFSVETIPDISTTTKTYLYWLEVFTIAIFTIEYAARIWAAEKPLKFVFSFYGVIDLAAILPFYLSSGLVDLRSVRAFRFLRLLRLLKFARYNAALGRFRVALDIAKEELIVFTVFASILLYVSAVGIYYFERDVQPEAFRSVFDALWWSISTLTTVGYGDIYPVTAGGRIFTFFVLMIGLGVVAVPTGLLASALTEARRKSKLETKEDGKR